MAGYMYYPDGGQSYDDWVPPNTPYDVRELLAARNSFRQSFHNRPSNGMLSLMNKSQFAIHGGQGARGSFHNTYFTDIQKQRETIVINSESSDTDNLETIQPDIQRSRDSHTSNLSRNRNTPDAAGSDPIPQIRCVQKTYPPFATHALPDNTNRKRKLPGNETATEPDITAGLPAKRRSIGDIDNRVSQTVSGSQLAQPAQSESNNLNILWRCDYCFNLEKSRAVMQEHLKSKNHFSASLSRCIRKKGMLDPISILAPAKLTELSAFCKKQVPVCPDVKCCTIYPNVYQCSLHYVRSHNKTHIMNRYSLGTVLQEKEISFYSNKVCYCGKKLPTLAASLQHWENCTQSKRDIIPSMPFTFMVYICRNCNTFIYTLEKMLTHIVGKCMKNRIGFRILQVKKADEWKLLLPNGYAVQELSEEIQRLRGPNGSHLQGNKSPKLLNKIKAVQTLKQGFHNFMKLRCENYDKNNDINYMCV